MWKERSSICASQMWNESAKYYYYLWVLCNWKNKWNNIIVLFQLSEEWPEFRSCFITRLRLIKNIHFYSLFNMQNVQETFFTTILPVQPKQRKFTIELSSNSFRYIYLTHIFLYHFHRHWIRIYFWNQQVSRNKRLKLRTAPMVKRGNWSTKRSKNERWRQKERLYGKQQEIFLNASKAQRTWNGCSVCSFYIIFRKRYFHFHSHRFRCNKRELSSELYIVHRW